MMDGMNKANQNVPLMESVQRTNPATSLILYIGLALGITGSLGITMGVLDSNFLLAIPAHNSFTNFLYFFYNPLVAIVFGLIAITLAYIFETKMGTSRERFFRKNRIVIFIYLLGAYTVVFYPAYLLFGFILLFYGPSPWDNTQGI